MVKGQYLTASISPSLERGVGHEDGKKGCHCSSCPPSGVLWSLTGEAGQIQARKSHGTHVPTSFASRFCKVCISTALGTRLCHPAPLCQLGARGAHP